MGPEMLAIIHTLGIQVPPQKVLGPSKPTPNTFSEGTWILRDSKTLPQSLVRVAAVQPEHDKAALPGRLVHARLWS